MNELKIGIIISTIREGRFGDKPAEWIFARASAHQALSAEIVDLRDYPLPMFAEAKSPAVALSSNEVAQRWAAKVRELDGFIFVTAEYNHSVPGVLKNALDYVYRDFNRKPAAFVGYGGVGGARAVEQLRLICIELQMAPTRPAVHIAGDAFRGAAQGTAPLAEAESLNRAADAMMADLVWWARTLKAGRQQG